MANQIILDRMAGSMLGSNALVSAKFATKTTADSVTTYTPAAIDNGMPVLLDGLIEGERELQWAIAPAANSPKAKIAVVASVEELTDEHKHDLSDYTNVAGHKSRVYIVTSGDKFSPTVGCFNNAASDEPIKGDIVELVAGTKWNAVTTLTEGSTRIGEIIDTVSTNGVKHYTIRVD